MSGEGEETGETRPTGARETVLTPAAAPVSPPSQNQHARAHRHLEFRFLDELKRRNVGRVAILYLVVCWLILEPVHVIFHMLEVPIWANRLVIILMTLGFPVALIFAWVYELTPEGLKPATEVDPHKSIRAQTGHRLNRAIIVVLAVALSYFVVDKFWLSKRATTSETASVAAESSAAGPAVPPIAEKSIAVLPFADMSEKHDQEYFADGMAEEIIDLLVKIPDLKVIGRTSSFQFKGKNEDLRAIGARLGVAYVLEGSIRRSGNKVRITAQVIEAQSGTHRWSDTYEREVGDVLKLQDEIAGGIARALQIAVGADELHARRTLSHPEAYEAYLRGRHALDRFDKDGFDESTSYFRQALDLDPTFADAAVALSVAYEMQANWAFVTPSIGFEQARRAAQSALKLDPALARANAVLGMINVHYDWDFEAADRALQIALKVSPHDPFVLSAAGDLQLALGHYANASRMFKESVTRDPLNPDNYAILSWAQIRLGQVTEAIETERKALEIQPGYVWASTYLAAWLLVSGDPEAALAAAQREDPAVRAGGLAMTLWVLGRKAESDAALKKAIAEQADSNAYGIAWEYAYRGDHDEAFKWLDRAYAQKDPCLYSIKGEPMLTNLEGDPRYKAFLKKMNLPE